MLFRCPVPDDHDMMTLTNDELIDPTAELIGGDVACRRPITDVNAWLDDLDYDARATLPARCWTGLPNVPTN
jgi:hypothetical protein